MFISVIRMELGVRAIRTKYDGGDLHAVESEFS